MDSLQQPGAEGAEYIAVCLPAFSPDTVHRDSEYTELMRLGTVLLMVSAVACSQAPPPPPAAPVPSKLEGMWSDPPPTAVGTLCFFACTDAAIDRLNALLDDPANDARPFPQLRRRRKVSNG